MAYPYYSSIPVKEVILYRIGLTLGERVIKSLTQP
jgi:hypothetical protein